MSSGLLLCAPGRAHLRAPIAELSIVSSKFLFFQKQATLGLSDADKQYEDINNRRKDGS
jgi:hypothetical protein